MVLFYGACFGFLEYLSVSNAININNLTNFIQGQMIPIATLSKAMANIGKIMAENTVMSSALKTNILLKKNNEQTQDLQDLRATLDSSTFKGHPSFFSYKGKALASFTTMEEIKYDFIQGLQVIGQIDAYVSLAKAYKKMAAHQNAHYCFAEYETASMPHIAATNYWHPFLNPDKVVTNSIEIGGTQPKNIILTGPNAAGKSTTLKALTTCLWLAHTTGIVPAEHFSCTPFKFINTYLNIADTEGRESLFQAEMHRAQALIDSLKTLQPQEFSFVIMDEIFTGTNPEEGQAGAYGIAQYLSKFTNSCCIVATHYIKLTELAEATQGAYKNYKVYVIKNADGSFTYPYKIEPGITDQAIALELLQQEGFASEILQSAQQAFSKIQAAKKQPVA
jgi:DNA mismatch repair protein MutS